MQRTCRTAPLTLAALMACQEYRVDLKPDSPDPPLDTDPAIVDSEPPRDSVPSPNPTCADVTVTMGAWAATAPFSQQADPTDGFGRPFHAVVFDAADLSDAPLPDRNGIPVGYDRAWRTAVEVAGSGPLLALEVQSDDGIAVWLDGALLGRWGGGWQEEGCVNDAAECLDTVAVSPIDVTAALTPGVHALAFRVSNPVASSYADLRIRCIED